jgi:GntR family transcriptional regulator, transcriptional repressor for pyruvate dehydrogenase complex
LDTVHRSDYSVNEILLIDTMHGKSALDYSRRVAPIPSPKVPTLARDPIHLPKAAVVVARRIRRGIVHGQFQPGQPLPNETELMALYEVSRPVVREALRILESESLINVKRGVGGGARVQRPDIGVLARHTALLLQLDNTTLEDVFEARSLIEPAAVRRLATLRPPGAIQRLKECHDDEMNLLEDLGQYPLVAARFHEELIELAGNKTIAMIGRLLLEIVETHNRTMFAALQDEGAAVARDAAEAWHARVIDMIEAGDADGAVDLWERHLREAAELTLDRLGPTTIIDLLDHDS